MVLPFASPSLFSLGFPELEGHLHLPLPGQFSSECWSNLSVTGGHQGQLWSGLSEAWTIRCALRTRYVQLLSGFVGTFGRLCWSCFTIVEMSCNRDSEFDRVFLGEGISFVDRESLSWAKLGHPCRVFSFESRARGYVADGILLMSGCSELDTRSELKCINCVCSRDGLFLAGSGK